MPAKHAARTTEQRIVSFFNGDFGMDVEKGVYAYWQAEGRAVKSLEWQNECGKECVSSDGPGVNGFRMW